MRRLVVAQLAAVGAPRPDFISTPANAGCPTSCDTGDVLALKARCRDLPWCALYHRHIFLLITRNTGTRRRVNKVSELTEPVHAPGIDISCRSQRECMVLSER